MLSGGNIQVGAVGNGKEGIYFGAVGLRIITKMAVPTYYIARWIALIAVEMDHG